MQPPAPLAVPVAHPIHMFCTSEYNKHRILKLLINCLTLETENRKYQNLPLGMILSQFHLSAVFLTTYLPTSLSVILSSFFSNLYFNVLKEIIPTKLCCSFYGIASLNLRDATTAIILPVGGVLLPPLGEKRRSKMTQVYFRNRRAEAPSDVWCNFACKR
jgi:hypothetical protein